MDADHVTAWSKGGVTDASNCEMLCATHTTEPKATAEKQACRTPRISQARPLN